jgi:hypothetical protein
VLRVSRIRRLYGLKKAAMTVLDGTGRLRLARHLFGDRLVETRVPFPRDVHITGTRGKIYSRQSITGEDREGNAIRRLVAPAAKLRGEIARIFGRLPAGSVIAGTQRIEDCLFDSGVVHHDTPSMHFGELRGRNAWEHCPGGLFIGAENISIADVEAMARAFMATDPAPFTSMDEDPPPDWKWRNQWPYRATRMRRMRRMRGSSTSTSPVAVPVHPDPRVQDVLELVREDELLQGIDRLRPVWHRRHLTLLNDLCLDVTYDAIHSHKHLVAGGNPIERARNATGIVPFSPDDLAKAHPSIFRTPSAAEHALRNYRRNLQEDEKWGLAVVSYRRVGQRGPEARLLLDKTRYPDEPGAVAAIERAIGRRLQSYQGIDLYGGGRKPETAPVVRPDPWMAPAPRQPGSGAAPPSVMVHGPPDG